MNRVLKPNHTPSPGHFKYQDDDTKEIFTHPYFVELRKMARKHRHANNLPYLSDDAYEDNVCRQKPEICGEEPPKFLTRAMTFARAMAEWAKKGFPVVDDATLTERSSICERCEHFGGWKTVGVACRKCGCARLKLILKTSVCADNPPKWKAVP